MTARAGLPRTAAWGVLLVALCLWLGWLAVRGAANDLLAAERPALAAAFWPASGEALANAAQARILAAGGSVDTTAEALLTSALHRSPASATPLVLAALRASARGDMAGAETLMAAARTRDPRNAVACFWQLDHFIRTGNYSAGLAQIGPALRLRGSAAPALFALVAVLAATPAARGAVHAALARDPPWRNGFFQSQATLAANPAPLLALLRSLPPARDPTAARLELQALLYAMVDHAAYAPAYAAWRASLPIALRPQPGAVYDPDFAGLPGPPPFNWSFPSTDTARITTGRTGGGPNALFIHYSNGAGALLAEQYLLVAPGRYGVSLTAWSTGDVPSDRLTARVICARDASVLAAVPLASLSPRPTVYRANATVPAGCDAIRVQIAAEAGAPDETAQAAISAIHLSRL